MVDRFVKCTRRLNNKEVYLNPEYIISFGQDTSGMITVITVDGYDYILTDTIDEFKAKLQGRSLNE